MGQFEFFSCFCGSSSDSEFRAEVNQVRMNQGPRGSWNEGWESRHGLRALFQCVDVLIVCACVEDGCLRAL